MNTKCSSSEKKKKPLPRSFFIGKVGIPASEAGSETKQAHTVPDEHSRSMIITNDISGEDGAWILPVCFVDI